MLKNETLIFNVIYLLSSLSLPQQTAVLFLGAKQQKTPGFLVDSSPLKIGPGPKRKVFFVPQPPIFSAKKNGGFGEFIFYCMFFLEIWSSSYGSLL